MGDSTSLTQISSQTKQTQTSNIDSKAKKASKSKCGKYSLISPDTKAKLGQYTLLMITFCFITALYGGSVLLPFSSPIIVLSLLDGYLWNKLTNAPKLELKDDKGGAMLKNILTIALPILFLLI